MAKPLKLPELPDDQKVPIEVLYALGDDVVIDAWPVLVDDSGASWLFSCRVRGMDVADLLLELFTPAQVDDLATVWSRATAIRLWNQWRSRERDRLSVEDGEILRRLSLEAFLARAESRRKAVALNEMRARYGELTAAEFSDWLEAERVKDISSFATLREPRRTRDEDEIVRLMRTNRGLQGGD